ncbi:SUMF1/EgtB/PvdO family nonheme iron enzyme [Verrucomicrobiaceae bacterium 227]
MDTHPEIARELETVDRRSRELLADLSDEQLRVPYERGINPPIWELGHSAFFYEYFLLRKHGNQTARMPGYDEVWDSFEIMHKHRWTPGVVPDRATMLDYYSRVMDETRGRIDVLELDSYEHYLFRYVIHHQQMHLESLIWARQTLGYPAPAFSDHPQPSPGSPGESGDAAISGGEYFIGMPDGVPGEAGHPFSFDNERPGFRIELPPFKISKTLVSNREFLEFVNDGAYQNPALWNLGGQCWLGEGEGGSRDLPAYWRLRQDGSPQVRKFETWIDLPLDAPALHLSVWEAEAFCRWAGRRLPTEPEWEAAARGPEALPFPWGKDVKTSCLDMDGTLYGTAPATAFAEGASPGGCLQMLGTAWEWTSSQFLPYDGFKIDMYHYMSVLQFGDHRVTKGGSCATSSALIRNSYRQAYHPSRTDAFTGFRTCAR